jgi:branched-chain amino acid aminotransferase
MINCNGSLVSSLVEGSEQLIESLHSEFSFEEIIRIHKGQILFWENHYFRITAALRRHRFRIPMNYTLDFLKSQITEVSAHHSSESQQIRFQFIKKDVLTFFIVSSEEVTDLDSPIQSSHSMDLYKEEWIPQGFFSNLSSTNQSLRIIAKSYAEENGLDDCFLMNNQKNLVESNHGSIYLLQKDLLITPDLESGCQDFVLRSSFNEWMIKKNKDIKLVEENINPFELQKSEEIMVLSPSKGACFVSQYRKTHYSKNRLGVLFSNFVSNLD